MKALKFVGGLPIAETTFNVHHGPIEPADFPEQLPRPPPEATEAPPGLLGHEGIPTGKPARGVEQRPGDQKNLRSREDRRRGGAAAQSDKREIRSDTGNEKGGKESRHPMTVPQ